MSCDSYGEDELKKIFDRYVDTYKKANEYKDNTGGGLTEVKMQAGSSIEHKLNKMYLYFKRMNVIFGERTNINLPTLGNIGLDIIEEESNTRDSQILNSQIPSVCSKHTVQNSSRR